MDERFINHLHCCKITEIGYTKVVKKINSLQKTSPTNDQLLVRFANKAYGKQRDRKLAKVQAKHFLEALFGSMDDIMDYGPEVAAYLTVFGSKRNLKEYPKSFKHYLIGYDLGKGKTSEVKLALNLLSDKNVALKIMKSKQQNVVYAAKEVSILKQLHHKNIVQVYESFENVRFDGEKKTLIAIEYVQRGNLIDWMRYIPKFDDELARWFFTSLVEGVEYCHDMKIIHRDLKHDNCLLSKDYILKITDFGFATQCYGEKMKTFRGTEGYMAPEIHERKDYDGSVDIFAMGVMLFIAIAGTFPWRMAHHTKDRWYSWVHSRKWDEFFNYHGCSHNFTNDQKTIMKGLLEPDPEKRWTLTDIQNCRWYRGRKNAQREVPHIMRRRKRSVERKKYNQMQVKPSKGPRRNVDIYAGKIPEVYFRPIPLLSFITDKNVRVALEDIKNAIKALDGTIIDNKEDEVNFKLTFQFTRSVDTTWYKNEETKEKLYDKVRVHASVQMWTLPGQQKAVNRAKALAVSKTENKESLEAFDLRIQNIKSIAVFRSDGSSYLFPEVFSDILIELPADIINKDSLYTTMI